MTGLIKGGIKACLWLLALTPLIFDPKVFFPYISGKDFYIQIIAVILAVLVFILLYDDRSRSKLLANLGKVIKSPIYISFLIYFLFVMLSLIFSPDRYMSFWGRLSRADGVSSYFFFTSIFILFGVFFKTKDWVIFFKLNLFTAFILSLVAFSNSLAGELRPDSLVGNPGFLAGYMLFSLTFTAILFFTEKSIWWKSVSVLVGLLSFVSIFISQTRGAIVGLFVGLVVAIFGVITKKMIDHGASGKKIFLYASVLAVVIILSIGGLFLTRNSNVWKNIPGVSRLVSIDLNVDKSASSRVLLYREALAVASPAEAGWGKFLLGWGQENFMFVSAQNYIPKHYMSEISWFDRVHNRVFDAFISNGILGAISYLAVWLCFLYVLWKRKNLGYATRLIILSWGAAFFVHLFFLFDQIATSLLFFAVLAFVSNAGEGDSDDENGNAKFSKTQLISAIILVVLFLACIFVFFYQTAPKYLKMREYTSLVKTKNLISVDAGIKKLFDKDSNADGYIIHDYLKMIGDTLSARQDQVTAVYLENAYKLAEGYIEKKPEDFLFLVPVASSYTKNGKLLSDEQYLKRGEELFAKILSIAPNRPEMNRGLASNLFYQERYNESFEYFEKTFNLLPEYWAKEDKANGIAYNKFISYFYEKKDVSKFVLVANRLIANNHSGSANLKKMVEFIEKNGRLPVINFN